MEPNKLADLKIALSALELAHSNVQLVVCELKSLEGYLTGLEQQIRTTKDLIVELVGSQ